jgi:nicotinate-nucleotide--dimethylbenzimidazole phosphoribosyltransferase
MLPTVSSFADIRRLATDLPAADSAAQAACAAREGRLTKPAGALGRLEEISAWLSTWQGMHPPRAARPRCVVFAGNHGVAARGVSAFPAEVTVQMVANFQAGGAAINQLCRSFGTELSVIPLDLDRPTGDFTIEPAMSEAECVAAFTAGMAAVGDCDLLCIGEMGIANTSAAAAVTAGLFGGAAADWCGQGTGVVGEAMQRKIEAVAAGLARHLPAGPLEVLARLGGRELAAMAGAAFGARFARVPVLLDGYVCTAAAAVLEALQPGALDHCLVAHASTEPGHRRLIQRLGKTPLLDLGMRLGEASGAALAVSLVKAAAACHAGMATFGEAGVSDKEG